MASHALRPVHPPRPSRAARRNGLLHLGWPHYWLMAGILAAGLASYLLILFASLAGT